MTGLLFIKEIEMIFTILSIFFWIFVGLVAIGVWLNVTDHPMAAKNTVLGYNKPEILSKEILDFASYPNNSFMKGYKSIELEKFETYIESFDAFVKDMGEELVKRERNVEKINKALEMYFLSKDKDKLLLFRKVEYRAIGELKIALSTAPGFAEVLSNHLEDERAAVNKAISQLINQGGPLNGLPQHRYAFPNAKGNCNPRVRGKS